MVTRQKPKPPYLILQVKSTFSYKTSIRVVSGTTWVPCTRNLLQNLLLNATRVLPFEGVGKTTDCWELELPIYRNKDSTVALLDYAKKVEAVEVHAYLTNAITIAEKEHKQKKQHSLAGNPLTYETFKERG